MHYAVAVLTLGVAFSATCLVAVISVQLSGQDIHCNDQGEVPKFHAVVSGANVAEKKTQLVKIGWLVGPKNWTVRPWNLPCLTKNGRSFSVAA